MKRPGSDLGPCLFIQPIKLLIMPDQQVPSALRQRKAVAQPRLEPPKRPLVVRLAHIKFGPDFLDGSMQSGNCVIASAMTFYGFFGPVDLIPGMEHRIVRLWQVETDLNGDRTAAGVYGQRSGSGKHQESPIWKKGGMRLPFMQAVILDLA